AFGFIGIRTDYAGEKSEINGAGFAVLQRAEARQRAVCVRHAFEFGADAVFVDETQHRVGVGKLARASCQNRKGGGAERKCSGEGGEDASQFPLPRRAHSTCPPFATPVRKRPARLDIFVTEETPLKTPQNLAARELTAACRFVAVRPPPICR